MIMEETWRDELNNRSDVDVSILDREILNQDMQPFLHAPDADHYFTGADHDHMTQTLEEGSELDFNMIFIPRAGVSCSDDHYGGRDNGMSEVSEQNLLGHHEQQGEEIPDFSDALLKKKMKAKGESSARNRTTNWTEIQTDYLVECKKELTLAKGHGIGFSKGKDASNDWVKISQKFSEKFASDPDNFKTSKQCRLRWDTVLKAFKKIKTCCELSGKDHTELYKEEMSKLELATTLRIEWYEVIDKFCPPRSKKRKLRKNDSLDSSPGGANHKWLPNLSIENGSASSSRTGVQARAKERSKQIDIQGFNELPDNLMKSILLDFVFHEVHQYEPMEVFRWLALVHDKCEGHIMKCVLQLMDLKLISIYRTGENSIKFDRMQVYCDFAHEVLRDSPDLRIHLNLRHTRTDAFRTTAQHWRLKVLVFHKCDRLKDVDLNHVPKLKSLTFNTCPNLSKVDGWERLTELGQLDVTYCPKLYPTTKNLKALTHFNTTSETEDEHGSRTSDARGGAFDTRTMTKMEEYVNLNNLRALEKFEICDCKELKNVGDGFGGLRALVACSFRGCSNLHDLPDVGNLVMLKYLDIRNTKIDRIPGLEKLNKLETLNCCFSKLTVLPDLNHMLKLRELKLEGTPLDLYHKPPCPREEFGGLGTDRDGSLDACDDSNVDFQADVPTVWSD